MLFREVRTGRSVAMACEVHPSVRLPEGLVFNEGYYATSTVFTVRDGVDYDHSAKNTEYAPFSYSG
jgi:hypothetical protein